MTMAVNLKLTHAIKDRVIQSFQQNGVNRESPVKELRLRRSAGSLYHSRQRLHKWT